MPDDVIRNDAVREPPRSAVGITEVFRSISWGAVWAGLMIALGMEVLFSLFGSFIGFGMYNWQAANPWAGISAWTTVWYLITAGWSMFFGAWCAARLSANPTRHAAILHGITTWGLATAATIAIVGVASWAVFREGINLLGTAAIAGVQVTPAGQAAAQMQPNAGLMAQATANILSGLSLRIWAGVLLGFITAVLGGWMGRPLHAPLELLQAVPGPTRRAA